MGLAGQLRRNRASERLTQRGWTAMDNEIDREKQAEDAIAETGHKRTSW